MNEAMRDQAQDLRDKVGKSSRSMKLVTIASGKGGVGKSSIAVNMAIALSMLGYRALVVDADFGLANVDVMLGVTTRYNLGHLIRGERTIYEIIQEGHKGVRFISGGSGVYELLQMDENQLKGIMHDLMRLRNPADIILFDAGAGINENVLQLVDASTEVIVVTTPEPTAILDAYALIKTIVKNGPHNIRLIMNKSESKKEADMAIEGFTEVVRKHLGVEIERLGHVAYDHTVVSSIKRQTPIMISHPEGPAAKDIMNIARNLVDMPAENIPTSKIARLFARLLG